MWYKETLPSWSSLQNNIRYSQHLTLREVFLLTAQLERSWLWKKVIIQNTNYLWANWAVSRLVPWPLWTRILWSVGGKNCRGKLAPTSNTFCVAVKCSHGWIFSARATIQSRCSGGRRARLWSAGIKDKLKHTCKCTNKQRKMTKIHMLRLRD